VFFLNNDLCFCYLQQLHALEICLKISLLVNLFQIMSFIYRIIICNMYRLVTQMCRYNERNLNHNMGTCPNLLLLLDSERF
jgi:hypothetical protein